MKSTSEVSVYAGRYQVSQTMDAPGLDSEADGAYILECLICHPPSLCWAYRSLPYPLLSRSLPSRSRVVFSVEPICPFPIAVRPPSQWRFKALLLLVLIPSSDASTNVFQIFQIRGFLSTGGFSPISPLSPYFWAESLPILCWEFHIFLSGVRRWLLGGKWAVTRANYRRPTRKSTKNAG